MRNHKGQFLPGVSGNPAGRPKGSKNKLATSFFDDCYAVWQENGKKALEQMLAEDPASFNRMIASTMPKELDIDSTSSDGSMTPPAEIRIFAVQPEGLMSEGLEPDLDEQAEGRDDGDL